MRALYTSPDKAERGRTLFTNKEEYEVRGAVGFTGLAIVID